VVASGLNNPRKIFLGTDGAVYVVEAGTGGRSKCLGTGTNRTCVGLTGSIARIVDGAPERVVTGLFSGARPNGDRAQGPADVLVRAGTYYVLLQGATIDSRGVNALGPDAVTASDLISTPTGKAAPAVIVNLAAFEAARNPDRGAGPGAKLGSPPLDSNPYAFTDYRGGFAIADAGGNDLLWLGPDGEVSVLAVFPIRNAKITKETAEQLRLPATVTSVKAQSVPSSVAVGPDGALYVGELTGVPFERGSARIWRVVPGEKKTVYASGFTSISDLAFDGDDLLVLEIAADGLLEPDSPGALIRLAPDGTRTEIASKGLVSPTGVAVGNGSIYISNYGISRGSGPGPHGELVSLPSAYGEK
jgi:hypothetical protein